MARCLWLFYNSHRHSTAFYNITIWLTISMRHLTATTLLQYISAWIRFSLNTTNLLYCIDTRPLLSFLSPIILPLPHLVTFKEWRMINASNEFKTWRNRAIDILINIWIIINTENLWRQNMIPLNQTWMPLSIKLSSKDCHRKDATSWRTTHLYIKGAGFNYLRLECLPSSRILPQNQSGGLSLKCGTCLGVQRIRLDPPVLPEAGCVVQGCPLPHKTTLALRFGWWGSVE